MTRATAPPPPHLLTVTQAVEHLATTASGLDELTARRHPKRPYRPNHQHPADRPRPTGIHPRRGRA